NLEFAQVLLDRGADRNARPSLQRRLHTNRVAGNIFFERGVLNGPARATAQRYVREDHGRVAAALACLSVGRPCGVTRCPEFITSAKLFVDPKPLEGPPP